MLLCGSTMCERYLKCDRAVLNNSLVNEEGRAQQVENFYSYGSGIYSMRNGKPYIHTDYLCGPNADFGMFIPKSINNEELCTTNVVEEKPASLWEVENKTIEEKEMDDWLKVDVEIYQYNSLNGMPGTIHIKSCREDDNFVMIECDKMVLKLKGSELEKAISCCTHNRF